MRRPTLYGSLADGSDSTQCMNQQIPTIKGHKTLTQNAIVLHCELDRCLLFYNVNV